MKKPESLDELISKKAAEFADQIKAAAAMADKEEEIRIEAERQLAFIERATGIKLEGKHEFTVARGRADSVYSRVIIEYKNPKASGSRLGPTADAPGSKRVIEQLKNRFYDMRNVLGHELKTMFGVGLDGNYFIFVTYRDDKWQTPQVVEVNKYSAERFLWALYNLGDKGRPFSAEYLAGDFGAEGGNTIAIKGVQALYDAIVNTDDPKAQTFFSQWKILFGEVCGYDVDNPSATIRDLAEFYGIEHRRTFRPAELLFAVHTYYALFIKLLASEIVAYFHKLTTPLQRMVQAGSSKSLLREMESLEAGSIFHELGITNFLEGDLFAWYTSLWSEPIESLVRGMIARLDDYHPGTLSEDPVSTRDLLKKLYQQLFPKSVRHDLGEYYTPDWLAEHVVNELEYVGDPDKRLLDPACGSGTFLVMAISRIRKWYEDNREQCRFDEADLLRKILTNVVGFDLNPLAVMTARTNYLIAIRGLISFAGKIEIPVYLCDSISTPFEYGSLFQNELGKVKKLRTAVGEFVIPEETASNRTDVAKYAELLESCIRDDYSVEEFLERCGDEGLSVGWEAVHSDLYLQLVELKRARKNGVWARIIKNAFAPLFSEPVDYVIGNPPWVRWGYLPQQYRTDIKFLWRRYKLFTQKGLESLMGTAEVDLSLLFTYACLDRYLELGGSLGFLITQEVVRSKTAGQGFRAFVLAPGMIPVKVRKFHDLVAIKPFEAENKTGAIFLTKGVATDYPVPYTEWKIKSGASVSSDDSLDEVIAKTTRTAHMAQPVSDLRSAWQVIPQGTESLLSKIKGQSAYKGRRGASLDPYAVFLCNVLSREPDDSIVVINEPSLGRSDVPQMPPTKIESTRVFPVVRGKDIERWKVGTVYSAIILNSSTRKADIPTEREIKLTLPKTYGYLFRMRSSALKREQFWQFFSRPYLSEAPLAGEQLVALGNYARAAGRAEDGRYLYEVADGPFFALFNIGSYTFSPHKVVWRRMGNQFKAAVVGETDHEMLGKKVLVPGDTTSFVSLQSSDEAHYVCAILNSAPCKAAVHSFSSAGRGFGAPSILQNLRLPTFDRGNATHRHLAKLSIAAHESSLSCEDDVVRRIEAEVDEVVASLWKLSPDEVAKIALMLKSQSKRTYVRSEGPKRKQR